MTALRRATALLAAVVLTLPAVAQQAVPVLRVPKAFLVMSTTVWDLVMEPAVQKELNLSDEQVEKLRKAFKAAGDKRTQEREKRFDPKTKSYIIDQAQEKIIHKKWADEITKAIADILQPQQSKRLKQIEVQQRGLSDPDNQQALQLTGKQKDRIKSINDDLLEKIDLLLSKGLNVMEEAPKVLKEGRERMANVLSDEQKKTWKEMTGEPFELPIKMIGRGNVESGPLPIPKVPPKDAKPGERPKKEDPNKPDIFRAPLKKIEI
jgi:hypothetical protein